MINEDYCSYGVAKLLEEKGFNEPIRCWYDSAKNFHERGVEMRNSDCISPTIMCPTLQMAMKWLREVHNIHIVIHPYTEMEGHNWSFIFDTFAYGCWQELGIYITDSWNTYEEAVEAALKYALENLI